MSQYSKDKVKLLKTNKDIYEVFMSDNTTIQSADFNQQVAMNKVPGVTGLSISGYRQSTSTAFLPAWEDGTYVYFPTAQVVRV